MTLRQRYEGILGYFRDNVPVAESELHFDSPYQLLVAVMLSAQCTDRRVNQTTPALYAAYPTPEALAAASFEDVIALIRSVSYPNSKARHLIGMAQKLMADFGGQVPSDIDALMTLPGVGRKTANVVASITWGEPVIAVDTHVFRVSRRLGLSRGTTPPHRTPLADPPRPLCVQGTKTELRELSAHAVVQGVPVMRVGSS